LDELSWAAAKDALIEMSPAARRTSMHCLSMKPPFSKQSVYMYECDSKAEVAGTTGIPKNFAKVYQVTAIF
jgi:hypothetical protein